MDTIIGYSIVQCNINVPMAYVFDSGFYQTFLFFVCNWYGWVGLINVPLLPSINSYSLKCTGTILWRSGF